MRLRRWAIVNNKEITLWNKKYCVNEASMLGSQHIVNLMFLRTVYFEMRQQTHITFFGEYRHNKSSSELQKPVLKLSPCAYKIKLLGVQGLSHR